MLKVGLIGCGGMGHTHAAGYEDLKDKVKVVAVADVREDKCADLKDTFGCDVYKTGMELIENADVDYVDICVPTYLHAEHAVAAMRKGFDVFVEKPVCISDAEAELLEKVQKETGRKVQVGHVVRFMTEYAWLKNAVDSGKYGKLLSANFSRLSVMPTWGWEDWFADADKCGSVALDLHIHDADFIRYLCGDDIKKMSAACTRDKNGMINHLNVLYQYEDKMLSAEGSWDCRESQPFRASYTAFFEKATVFFNGLEDGLVVCTDDKKEKIEAKEELTKDVGINIKAGSAYADELEYFIDEILIGNGKEMAPLSEGIKSVKLVFEEMKLCD